MFFPNNNCIIASKHTINNGIDIDQRKYFLNNLELLDINKIASA